MGTATDIFSILEVIIHAYKYMYDDLSELRMLNIGLGLVMSSLVPLLCPCCIDLATLYSTLGSVTLFHLLIYK